MKTIVISAINFFEAGPLSVLKDCLNHLNDDVYVSKYKIIALVHKLELFKADEYRNINFIEYPKSRKSYCYRLYYEYIHFKTIAVKQNVFFWLSLHDISPNVGDIPQAVYCHNASPFGPVVLKDIYVQPTQLLFSLFYKYLYKINIKRNKYVIVQQLWIKEKFHEVFGLKNDSIIIAKPQVPEIPAEFIKEEGTNPEKLFFFPTFPRPFKNIEVICEAVKMLNEQGTSAFKVIITIDGTENYYSRDILKKYQHIPNINFVGLLKREEVYSLYGTCDCLIFPSKLETWGLPITEFKQYNKPMIVSDLPYAKESVGDYDKAKFFNPSDAKQLAQYMRDLIDGDGIGFSKSNPIVYPAPLAQNWQELFNILLVDNKL
ncbi:glycosyltransferase [Pedobacter sp. LMG 31462]|uniref:Glycosyltransferase n=1 Tax=Pedobacter gandavensis TaxID=2679963 RepID=A0ABR6EX79_9SPHI|nr:glycosyltransferase [Pedobacter gandavensis]